MSGGDSRWRVLLEAAVGCGASFYCYRQPSECAVHCGAAPSVSPCLSLPGYVVTDFTNSHTFTFTSDAGYETKLIAGDIKPDSTAAVTSGIHPFPEVSTSRPYHERIVAAAVECLAGYDQRKIVLSRVLIGETERNIAGLFSSLCEAYPAAYVFCFISPQTGCWLGASPELLLRSDGARLHTMALAGTRPACSSDVENGVGVYRSVGDWDQKNILEQRCVTDFIQAAFEAEGYAAEAGMTYTRGAGPVEHICTDISAVLHRDFGLMELQRLLRRLSPTPALGGYPRDAALQFIRNNEKHSRAFYGGYCGFCESPLKFELNVNLRSMRLRSSGYEGKMTYAIYAGGGITAYSHPAAEWDETTRKASSLLPFVFS